MGVVEQFNKKREEFFAKRAVQEKEVLAFAEAFSKIPKNFYEGKIDVPAEITLQALVPEVYKENGDEGVCREQYAKAQEFFDSINKIIEDANCSVKDYGIQREEFLQARTKQELAVKDFAKKFAEIPSKFYKDKVEVPDEISLHAMVPEVYVEGGDNETCQKQYVKAQEFFTKMNKIFENVNGEYEKCMSEYRVLVSSKI